ncbi:MAG: hypothetical protein HRU09_21080 [Oligoflexales bacterium]|nr:hypothetical protein [Oligoflexales bacterium]
MKKVIVHLAMVQFLLSTSKAAVAGAIEWDYNNKANAIGSGCSMEDTFFLSAGDEVSIIFSNLGVELDGSQDQRLEGRKFCRIKIPALIRQGYYLTDLNSSLLYGLVRSEGTEAHINLQYRFLGARFFRNKDYGKNPRESRNIPLAELRDKKRIRNPKRCSGRDFRSVLFARASVAASRKKLSEGVLVHLDGLSLRLDARASMKPCRVRRQARAAES